MCHVRQPLSHPTLPALLTLLTAWHQRWFDYLNLGKYSDLPVENDLDGKTLLSLNDEDLLNLGVDDVSQKTTTTTFYRRRSPSPSRTMTASCWSSTCTSCRKRQRQRTDWLRRTSSGIFCPDDAACARFC
jgi:hypothetical protein